MRPLRARIQMIFQDPQSSLNPRLRLGITLTRPLGAYRPAEGKTRPARSRRRAAHLVGLPAEFVGRYPHELSGGQRQRAGIARALALEPDFIVADEIVSGLDVSTQAHILLLLKELRARLGLTMVFISHDLSVVRVLCDDVAILNHGEVVEYGPVARIFSAPQHAYTRQLLAAIPLPDVEPGWLDDPSTACHPNSKDQPHDRDHQGFRRPHHRRHRRDRAGAHRRTRTAAAPPRSMPPRAISRSSRRPMRLVPVKMDVTSDDDVAKAAARAAADVTLLINNAGVNHNTAFMLAPDLAIAREEIEINYLAPLRVTRAFAPALIAE